MDKATNFMPDKPYLTTTEMIHKLKIDYGLEIKDESCAVKSIEMIGYYNLINGYQGCFIDPTTERYRSEIDIEFLCRFHYFDKNFQHIFLKYCTYIEDSFKTRFANVLAENFGVSISKYLNPKCYSNPYTTNNSDRSLNKTLEKIKNNTIKLQNPTKHYTKNHNHIPPWILFKNTNFTDCIDLYSFLKKREKTKVLEKYFFIDDLNYNLYAEFFKISITLIRRFRNKIAHNLKYFSFKPTDTKYSKNLLHKIIKPTKLLSSTEIDKNKRGANDVYAFLLSILFLLGSHELSIMFIEDIIVLMAQDIERSNEIGRPPLFEKYCTITELPKDLYDKLSNFYEHFLVSNPQAIHHTLNLK